MSDLEKSTAEWWKKKVSSQPNSIFNSKCLLNLERRNASQIRLGGGKNKNDFNRHQLPHNFNRNSVLLTKPPKDRLYNGNSINLN